MFTSFNTRRMARLRFDGRVRIEDFDQPGLSFELDDDFSAIPYRTLVFLTDNRLGIAHTTFQMWDIDSRERIAAYPRWSTPVVRSPGGRFLAFKNDKLSIDP